jgi:hypothetical protein
MIIIHEVMEAVRQLYTGILASFRAWLAEIDSSAWNRQIENDVASGKLDALAKEAIVDHHAGRCNIICKSSA